MPHHKNLVKNPDSCALPDNIVSDFQSGLITWLFFKTPVDSFYQRSVGNNVEGNNVEGNIHSRKEKQ